MALEPSKKKRISLQSIVNRLTEKADTREHISSQTKQVKETMVSPRVAAPVRPYLFPPTPSSGPVSPAISEESVDEEEQVDAKGAAVQGEREEIRKAVGICRQPMRCEVCGLRVYKSYRYISRNNAPLHLKNFVTANVDRVRVCKRCFSSRERCRQNLTLILLRSKTSQMMHLRTPLGVTYNRATKAMEHITQDLQKVFKRPYDDLLCDETMADEDEMEVDDERFLLSDPVENDEPTKLKMSAYKSGTKASSSKNTGIVTVVRPQNGKYSLTPNCPTLYGDVGDVKFDKRTNENIAVQIQSGPQIDATANLKKLVDQGTVVPPTGAKNASSEINSINNKLTLLDHPYALQPPSGSGVLPFKSPAVVKPTKQIDLKSVKELSSSLKQLQPRKTVVQDGQTASERTCGIVCILCEKLVTKSYSCYKKENAPDKVKHLFAPGVKVVKICRRCLPYKKPKGGESPDASGKGKSKMKINKGKLVKIHSAKLVKNAKTSSKGKTVNMPEKSKVSNSEKTAKKSPTKEESKKRKDSSRDDKSKIPPAKKQCIAVTQTSKIPASKVNVSKDTKTVSSKGSQLNPKISLPVKEPVTGKTVSSKSSSASIKVPEVKNSSGTTVEKIESNIIKKENASGKKVDSGTQSMKSMIGVKGKAKPASTTAASNSKDARSLPTEVEKKESTDVYKKDDKVDSKGNVLQKINTQSNLSKSDKEQGAEICDTNDEANEPTCARIQGEVDRDKKIQAHDRENSSNGSVEIEDKQSGAEVEREGINNEIGLSRREKRSVPKSPVRTREIKSTEVSSPRRSRTTATPERKGEDSRQIAPTVMTRKRMASFCESESDKSLDDEVSNERQTPKRHAVAALLEKMSRKSGGHSASEKDAVDDEKQEDESKGTEKSVTKQVGSHCMTRRNQAPVLCARCSEKVVKSYRCILRAQSPSHIKPLFTKQSGDMLRICRRCFKKPVGEQETQ